MSVFASVSVDTDILILGAGSSGIAFAVQLQRQFPGASYEILEKANNLGGTWWVNTYPGCGCDVASHFYSFSFALNPNWSRKFAPQIEIAEYLHDVAVRNDIPRHVRFLATVQSAAFDEDSGTWVVTVRDGVSGKMFQRRSRILISAVGALSVPKSCELQGAERFKGRLFHSAQWDHSFDWAGKDVVVIGNGCSATQFVPVMSDGHKKTRKLVQFSRQPHWLAERPNPTYSRFFKWTMRYVPLAMRLYRFYLYALMEKDFLGFYQDTGGSIREDLKRTQIEYMKKNAPERYHDALIPQTEIGCKRKVMETDYLACLHRENVELVHSDPIEEVTETGVRTQSGREVQADAIILANGFQTQQVLFPMEITGEDGVTLNEHWDKSSSGSAQAYYGTCVSEFPNFFILMGPNTTTGHLSVIFSTECEVNFTLRVLRPILGALYPSRIWSILTYPFQRLFTPAPNTVTVTPAAEHADNNWIQAVASKLIWATGCTSWYVDPRTGRNTMLYPDWQFNFWARSIFVPLKRDFVFGRSPVQLAAKEELKKDRRSRRLGHVASGLGLAGVAVVVGLMVGLRMEVNDVEITRELRNAVARVQSECVTGLRSLPVLAGWTAV
ncbi:hypothetical protein N7448_000683 [Penicillium atrosanguineum]|uniref:Uncharacterized protein n=1 Tax=Penicillium atrosanguineum TaxID=1132637 RepID=A0A9W9Q3F0_9EURO|nr:hypothetical protein N7526_005657 [Penicillium atrosanguineum]KAJ5149105.1 hypothetical protein N7448_000683 [Penicillium atrosanguineum]KAJ5323891.1 hypothetical protein N7476_002491 [Penicillium atrosanguineum]